MAERNTTVQVPDVCCATEEAAVRKAFQSMKEIESLDFDLTNRTIRFQHDGETGIILDTLRSAGFPGRVTSQQTESTSAVSIVLRWSVLAAMVLLAAGLALSWSDTLSDLTPYLFLLSMSVGGWDIGLRCFRALRALRLDVNVLMTVAAVGAVILGEYAEGAAVLSLYSLSLLLEAMSVDRTRRAIHDLLSISPDTAHIQTPDGVRTVPIDTIEVGTTIIVKPGERIPLDGTVESGETSVDEAALTGESLPVYKGPESPVFAGTLNGGGSIDIVVTTRADNTKLHAISDMVEEARRKKDSVQTFMERFASRYVPAVFLLAVGVASIPPIIFGEPFTDWIYRALTLLVISCPCALLLSTPMAVVSAITGAARRGILIKSGEVLERISQIRAVAVDKTGTITHGFHDVTTVVPLNNMSEQDIVAIAAALESRSEHPLARSIMRYARVHNINLPSRLEDFQSFPGKGVKGKVDGDTYLIGNHVFIEDHGICSPELERRIEEMEHSGETVLILAHESAPIGLIAARDTERSDAALALSSIRKTTGRPVTILTGDNETAGKALGRTLGIESVRAGLLPEDKTTAVHELTSAHGPIAMVGDGINDAPALATAHVGIALGGTGSDTAIEAADVVMLSPSLRPLSQLLDLGASAHRIIRFNIWISLLTKGVFLFLGVMGLSSLWLAILADDGITLLVLLNSLRLLKPGDDPVS